VSGSSLSAVMCLFLFLRTTKDSTAGRSSASCPRRAPPLRAGSPSFVVGCLFFLFLRGDANPHASRSFAPPAVPLRQEGPTRHTFSSRKSPRVPLVLPGVLRPPLRVRPPPLDRPPLQRRLLVLLHGGLEHAAPVPPPILLKRDHVLPPLHRLFLHLRLPPFFLPVSPRGAVARQVHHLRRQINRVLGGRHERVGAGPHAFEDHGACGPRRGRPAPGRGRRTAPRRSWRRGARAGDPTRPPSPAGQRRVRTRAGTAECDRGRRCRGTAGSRPPRAAASWAKRRASS